MTGGQGHITSGEPTLGGQETLLSDFPLEGKHSCHNLQCHCSTSFGGYCNTTKISACERNGMKDTYRFSTGAISLKQHSGDFFSLFTKGLEEKSPSKPLPSLSLAFDFFCVTTMRGVLVRCPAVDLLGR